MRHGCRLFLKSLSSVVGISLDVNVLLIKRYTVYIVVISN